MDIEKLIEQYMQAADKWEKRHPVTDTFDLRVQDALRDAATALSALQAENEKLRAEVESLKKGHCAGCSIPAVKAEQIRDLTDAPKLRAELEKVKRERDAAKSPEVLEAVDELMEFSRTRMSIGGWLCYVNVFGEWRGSQKED